jgi:hypothetical protein
VNTSVAKTVEYGVLNTHTGCFNILCFSQNWCSVFSASKMNLEGTIAAETYPNILTQFIALLYEINEIAGFSKTG